MTSADLFEPSMTRFSPHTTSIMFPVQPTQLSSVVPFARMVQERGSGRLWLGQSLGIETHQVFAALAGAGFGIPFGSAVSLTGLRHPLDAATQARSVAQLSGQPYVAGVGPGARNFQTMVRARPLPKPVTAAREYVTTMRTLIDDADGADVEGVEHVTRGSIPRMPAPRVELGLGVLRPAMARAAGQVADVAITWLTPPSYIAGTLVPELRKAAAEAGRPMPRVTTVVQAAVHRPGRDMTDLAYAGSSMHLSSEHYTDMLRRAGLPAWPDDPRRGAELLVRSGTFVSGTPEEIAAGLDTYREAGVEEVVVNLCGVYQSLGMGAAVTDLREIMDAVDGSHG